jgi:lipopolysaccharide export LptBFGC system permease protein LptF
MLAFALTLALLAASQWLTPASEREARQFEAEYFSETSVTHWGKRQPVSWSNLAGGWTCHITKFNRQALSGEQVFLLALRENREEQIRARRIFWDDAQRAWVLEDGSWAIFEPQPGIAGNSAMTEHRITQELAPLAETPEELFEPFDDPARFATSQLPGIIKSAQARHVPVAGLQVEYHARFAGALLPAVVVLLGAPLAARATRGGRSAAITLALGLALGYLMLFGVSQNLGRLGRLDPISAAWLANGVFSLAGVGLLRWAPN